MNIDNRERCDYESHIAGKLEDAAVQVQSILSRGKDAYDHESEFENVAELLDEQLSEIKASFISLRGADDGEWTQARVLFESSFTDYIHRLDKEARAAEGKVAVDENKVD